MSKFQLASDIHLYGKDRTHEIEVIGDYLLLAGDVVEWPLATDAALGKVFLRDMCTKFKKVFYIFGNHEFYNGNLTDSKAKVLALDMPDNFIYLDGDHYVLDDNTIIFGHTLWTNFDKANSRLMAYARARMNDFQVCTYILNGVANYWTPKSSYEYHIEGMKKLEKTCDMFPNTNILVMTHHAPSFKSVDPLYTRYGTGDIDLNFAYASDLEGFILAHPQIKHWVHGHMHNNSDYMVGDCRVICNPLGYHDNARNKGFNQAFVFNA